jgi:SAM-dependent methyltransferase
MAISIEVDKEKVEFAQKIGLKIYNIDIGKEDISLLPKVEAIWCSHVLEHVDSPHVFLRKLHQLLKPGGLVVLFVPTMPLVPILQHVPILGKLVKGYDVDDHINAFIPKTLQFFCERAGFETIEVSPFYPGILNVLNKLPVFNRFVSRCTYIGQKIEDWEYPSEATRKAEENLSGYRFR